MAIKDQRDRARTEAGVLERLTERDALTGLFNRRVIEGRFIQLRGEGFTTLALLDLDHFKAVNDVFGHAVGDQVLQSVAAHPQHQRIFIGLERGGRRLPRGWRETSKGSTGRRPRAWAWSPCRATRLRCSASASSTPAPTSCSTLP